MDQKQQIIEILEDIEEDTSVSRNIKEKVSEMKNDLSKAKDDDLSLVVNKILSDLEELSNDVNVPDFVRTQLWHLSSMLETFA